MKLQDFLKNPKCEKALFVKKLLSQKKYRTLANQFVLEGQRLINDAARAGAVFEYVIFEEGFSIEEISLPKDTRVFPASASVMKEISDTVNSQGIIAVTGFLDADFTSFLNNSKGFILILDQLNDPGNLGTIIRSADAFCAEGVLLLPGCVDLYSPKVVRATMSSIFNVPVFNVDFSVFTALKNQGYTIFGACPLDGRNIFEKPFPKKTAAVIGNEAKGISDLSLSFCDERFFVPMSKTIDSLNAGVAASLVMYEHMRQRKHLKSSSRTL